MKNSTREIRAKMPAWIPLAIAARIREAGAVVYDFTLSRSEKKVLRTPKPIKPSVWSERHRVVTMSRLPGLWKNEITAYLTDIMDAAAFPSVRAIIVCKAPQVGGSEAVHNFVGWAIDRDPGPVLYVYPDELTAKENSRDRIAPMIDSSPRLRSYKTGARDDTAQMRISLKHMPIYLGWATSASRLANKPIKHLVFDETDKYPASTGKRESDPISLGEKRCKTYSTVCKKWKISTPTVETGYIWLAMTTEAQVIFDYWVKCPLCGRYLLMDFEHIKWPADERNPETIETNLLAWYECNHCAGSWDDAMRDIAVRWGQWRSRPTGDRVTVGLEVHAYLKNFRPAKIAFHIPSWLSFFVSLSEVGAAFLKGLTDFQKKKDFRNAHEALPWKQRVVSSQVSDVLLKVCTDLPPQTVPAAAVALTAGIDMQKYGFWFVVRAWARDYTSWLVHYGNLATWEDVETLLFDTWYPVRDSSVRMRIFRAGLDTGGTDTGRGISMTEEAYMWLRKNGRGRGCRVWGTKGASRVLAGKVHVGKPLDKTPSGKPIPGGLQVIQLDTDQVKDMVHYRIHQALDGASNAAWLHKDTGEDWVRQVIESEEKQVDEKGRETWVHTRGENHLLDCEGICQCCADPEWPGGGIHLIREPAKAPTEAAKTPPETWIHNSQRPARPDWLDRR
ncbi:terminase gpA endonuclease subunit [uncultured Desulfosarcina sp.]|uniref:terminase gpA endonuclease subunit n=1 Tax=uncultured Desulfosarcina sp. TaxID=218289 RepID=UPI0029C891E7|nr:terminase gpA endonuclease subunit [uncultured Desulfosarcina sp.]